MLHCTVGRAILRLLFVISGGNELLSYVGSSLGRIERTRVMMSWRVGFPLHHGTPTVDSTLFRLRRDLSIMFANVHIQFSIQLSMYVV
jgi:hypothetical protein